MKSTAPSGKVTGGSILIPELTRFLFLPAKAGPLSLTEPTEDAENMFFDLP
jgi:hypothetical protein